MRCPDNPFDDPNDKNDGIITNNFDEDDYDNIPPGDYTYTFKVSAGITIPNFNPQFEIVQPIVDPCLTPTLLTPDFTN